MWQRARKTHGKVDIRKTTTANTKATTSSDSTTGFKTTELTTDLGTTTSEAITTSSAQSSSSTNNEETDSSVTATSLYGTNLTRTTVVDDDGNTMSHPASTAVAVTEKNGVKSGDRTREDGYRERYIGKVDIKETKKVTEGKENVTNHTTSHYQNHKNRRNQECF